MKVLTIDIGGTFIKYALRKRLDPESVDGVRVFEDVNAGDETAIDCLNEFAHEIAVQIFNIQTVLDPGRFAIGGGISAQPVLIETIRAHLKKLYSVCRYDIPRAEITVCRFREDASLIGAYHNLRERGIT